MQSGPFGLWLLVCGNRAASDLTASFLQRRHAELVRRFEAGWERRWLFAEWWVERLRAALAAGRVPAGACER